MPFEHEWIQFFREQYQIGSRIRLRDLQAKEQSMRPRKMGTLEGIEDDGQFKVRWDDGTTGYLMIGKDSFSVLPPKTVTMKLYMPMTAERFNYDYWNGYDDEGTPLTDRELLQHEDAIVSALHKYIGEEEIERGIMCWYGEENSVDDKVQSVFFTAEEREGKLWGVAVCRVVGELTPEELAELKDYVTGQASDGWGESFEQHEINTSDGDIYVHLWSFDDDWSIQTEQERFGVELEETSGMTMGGM